MAYDYDKSGAEFKIFKNRKEISEKIQRSITRVTVEASTFLPRSCEIEFSESPQSIGKDTYSLFSPGDDVAVFAYAQGNTFGDVIFKGSITGIEMISDEGSGVRTVFRCHDPSAAMVSGTKTRLWKQKTYSEVVKEIATKRGLNPFLTSKIQSTSVTHETIVQLNESDWDFICRLAREIGFVCFVEVYTEFTISKTRLVWAKVPKASTGSSSATRPKGFEVGDGRMLSLRAMVTGLGIVSSGVVPGWDAKQDKAALGSAAATSGDATSTQTARRSPKAYQTKSPGTRTSLERMATSAAEAKALAQGLAKRVASASVDIELIVRGHPAAKVNQPIYLDDALFLEGKYVASAITHEFGGNEVFVTTIYCTGAEDRSLAGLASDTHNRPALTGVYPAIVNSIEDPQGRGRVTLTLPWLDRSYITGWAPIMQMGAGKGVGWQALPAPKDEVIVAFQNGQLDSPYVLGGYYGKGDGKVGAKELIKNGKPVKQVLTTKAGHQIILNDEGDDSGITLRTKNGQTCSIVMSDKAGISIITKGNGNVNVTTDGNVNVAAKKNAKVSAQDVSVDSKGSVKVKAASALNLSGANVTVDATSSATVKGTNVKVEATGSLTLKGAVVNVN